MLQPLLRSAPVAVSGCTRPALSSHMAPDPLFAPVCSTLGCSVVLQVDYPGHPGSQEALFASF